MPKIFCGIVVLLTGDGLQIPVINSHGLLRITEKIPLELRDLHQHLTEKVFFLQLSESVRQGKDVEYANMLQRLRTTQCTDMDAAALNSRYVSSFEDQCMKYPYWSEAPILKARNHTVKALNNRAISKHGTQYGTFHIQNLPLLTKAESIASRRKIAEDFFKNRLSSRVGSQNERFEPPPLQIIYPAMPVMLGANICPSLGLSNGSIGRVCSVLSFPGMKKHEKEDEVTERCLNGDYSVPSLLVRFSDSYRGKIGAISSSDPTMTSDEAKATILIEPQVIGRVRGLPIVPAHALTMHKSQSLTLPYTVIDPRDTFCMRALYVAFS
ncbi:P-loop containing nucleoside triphosphate hydrolase [Gracilaria domingensis]|nr:P-loop containing nucleoside triphosphate hydrolase [Gracilaria domingensis]